MADNALQTASDTADTNIHFALGSATLDEKKEGPKVDRMVDAWLAAHVTHATVTAHTDAHRFRARTLRIRHETEPQAEQKLSDQRAAAILARAEKRKQELVTAGTYTAAQVSLLTIDAHGVGAQDTLDKTNTTADAKRDAVVAADPPPAPEQKPAEQIVSSGTLLKLDVHQKQNLDRTIYSAMRDNVSRNPDHSVAIYVDNVPKGQEEAVRKLIAVKYNTAEQGVNVVVNGLNADGTKAQTPTPEVGSDNFLEKRTVHTDGPNSFAFRVEVATDPSTHRMPAGEWGKYLGLDAKAQAKALAKFDHFVLDQVHDGAGHYGNALNIDVKQIVGKANLTPTQLKAVEDGLSARAQSLGFTGTINTDNGQAGSSLTMGDNHMTLKITNAQGNTAAADTSHNNDNGLQPAKVVVGSSIGAKIKSPTPAGH